MKLTIASILPFICSIGFCNSLSAFDKGGQLQLIENRGQVTDQHGNVRHDIDLKAEQGGVTLYVGSGEMHYQWIAGQSQTSKVKSQSSEDKFHGVNSKSEIPNSNDKSQGVNPKFQDGFLGAEPGEVTIYRMDVELVGANKGAEAVFEGATGYVENYYMPHLKFDGVQARGYNKVTYKNVYPEIDWVVYVAKSKVKIQNSKVDEGIYSSGAVLKYDFIVHEGGNVADIRLRYKGATELKIEDGALIATTPFGSITEAVPYSYEAATGREVTSSYLLQGNELSFHAGNYNGKLVIDPVLDWATYYGGNGHDLPDGCNVDTAGELYVCGSTQSTNNIATTTSFQTTLAGLNDGFVVKFNAAGVRQWCTYFGGVGNDRFRDLVVDTFGNVYCNGYTGGSPGLATAGAYQDTFGGGSDAILLKLRADNGTRIWSTYFGGAGIEDMSTIECDDNGNVYLGGGRGNNALALPTAGLATSNAFLSVPGWGTIVSFNSSGQRRWCTYYPARVYDIHYSRVNNMLYMCGLTDTTSGHATSGAHQLTRNGTNDAYLACFNTLGNRQWGTYYGGAGIDAFACVTTDRAGNIYAGGSTNSTTGVATQNTFQTTKNNSLSTTSGMLVKFTAAGKRIWGTYYGDDVTNVNGGTHIGGIGIDSLGMIYFGGGTGSSLRIATSDATQAALAGSDDLFAGIMDSSCKRIWGSYYGGAFDDANQVRMSYGKNSIYIAGGTSSSGIATTGAHQVNFVGNFTDCIFVRWDVSDTIVYIKEPFTDTAVCNSDTIDISYGVNRPFRNSNSFTVQLSNSSGSFTSPVNLAVINSNVGGDVKCIIPNGLPDGTGYKIRIVANSPIDTSAESVFPIKLYNSPASFNASVNKTQLCTADTLKLNSTTTTTGVTYSWTGPGSFSSSTANITIPNPTLAATGNYYIIIDNNGCKVRDTFAVTVAQSPLNVVATNNTPICTGDTLKLTGSSSTGGVSYNWSGPGNYNTANVTVPNAQLSHAGVYTFKVTLGNCSTSVTTTVAIDQAAFVNIVPLSSTTACAGDTIHFAGFPSHAGTNPVYQWQANGSDIPGAQSLVYQSTTLNNGDKIRLKLIPNSTCTGDKYSNEITVTVNPLQAPQVTMSASAGPSLFANEPITFTAVATDAGNAPEYQWLRNNQPVGGATGATWGANANFLSDGDYICVRVKSNYQCAAPETATSNCIKLNIRVSVQNIGELSGVIVYPNPVSSQLTVDSKQLAISSVVLYDMVGRVVAVPQVNTGSRVLLDMSAVPAGNYVLQVMGNDGSRGYYKITKE